MRVISGKLKGKRLFSAKGLNLRPTSDRVKEAIFDILQDRIQGQQVLDLFAGTGALGIEALSRGARRVVFIEKSRPSLAALHRNIADCKFKEQGEILSREVTVGIKILENRAESFAIIFLDPPYGKRLAQTTLEVLARSSIISPETLMVAEHSATEEINSIPGLQRMDRRKYGSTQVSFFRPDIEQL